MDRTPESRRRFLAIVGTAATGVAGCVGAPREGDAGATPTTSPPRDEDEDPGEERPAGVSREAFERGPVPEAYRVAVALGGEERDPGDLVSKTDVSFSEYDEALENPAHQPGRCCANCAEFIPDKDGDGFGACAEVEGYIDGADWCTIWEELPEPTVPAGMSEDDLATAEVPPEYRTAASQAGDERDPAALRSQAAVNFRESVEAIAEGLSRPGQSCGNCAEFIPDKNGDGWGACAAVAGYIANEDWCAVWEPISAELGE